MRIISFSHAPMQAFWTAPVQALVPWITRIRHSFGHSIVPSLAQRSAGAAHSSFRPGTATASNDAIFNAPPEITDRPCIPLFPKPARSVLRVVRESDAAIQPDCAGRMVISGRMADVCAELDRMALQAAPLPPIDDFPLPGKTAGKHTTIQKPPPAPYFEPWHEQETTK